MTMRTQALPYLMTNRIQFPRPLDASLTGSYILFAACLAAMPTTTPQPLTLIVQTNYNTLSSATSLIRNRLLLTSTSSLLSILNLHPTPMQRIQPPLQHRSLQRAPTRINSPTLRFENGYCEGYVWAGEFGPGYLGVEGDFCFPEVGGVGLDVCLVLTHRGILRRREW